MKNQKNILAFNFMIFSNLRRRNHLGYNRDNFTGDTYYSVKQNI